jgi:sugar-specific transcriptional regulator TrmB
LSLELAIKQLENLGLTQVEAHLYVYLAKRGPQTELVLAKALKLTKHQLSLGLKALLNKEIIKSFPESSIKYSAVTFEKVFDHLAKAKKEEAKLLQACKTELLSFWDSMIE